MNKYKIGFIIVSVLLIISLIPDIVCFFDRDLSDKRYEEIVKAIKASPKSAELMLNDQNVTDDFLDKYGTSIENEEYSEAIDYLKKNNISIGIGINKWNEFLLDGME